MTERTGFARVFTGPEPRRGAHPGYRGRIVADAIGIHLDENCQWLYVDADEDGERGWPMGEWDWIEEPQTIPWHKIEAIQWLKEDPVPTEGRIEVVASQEEGRQ